MRLLVGRINLVRPQPQGVHGGLRLSARRIGGGPWNRRSVLLPAHTGWFARAGPSLASLVSRSTGP